MIHNKKEVIAMLLAGGQGSRLQVLTENLAKPAVPFGGKYRIVDFTLSNCVNSHIDTVGVLTQYKPLILNEYIGNGQPWGLDRKYGGVHILPPYVNGNKAEWYLGTANAIYQNIEFIDQYRPEYLLVLSGDHIYSMDYQRMIEKHKESHAECTISVIDVPLEEASRFGILYTDREDRIISFEEKPTSPKSTKASMGIYVFNWEVLRKYLILDAQDYNSRHDFGCDIIPKMLKDERKLISYSFGGYWKDVGTIESLWQANLDLIHNQRLLGLGQKGRKIYTRNACLPPHYIGDSVSIKDSLISEGCHIEGQVENSVIFTGVTVGKNAIIRNSVVMSGTQIEEGAIIQNAILGENVWVSSYTVIGEMDDGEITVIQSGKTVENQRSSCATCLELLG